MAHDITLVPYVTPGVTAVQDFRTHQHKAVRFDAGGVRFSDTSANSGPCFILGNKPNSGEACTLVGPVNVTKAIAGLAVLTGNWVTVAVSGFCVPGSDASALLMGVAMTGAASGSTFDLYLRR